MKRLLTVGYWLFHHFAYGIVEVFSAEDVKLTVDENLWAIGCLNLCRGIFDGYFERLAFCPLADGFGEHIGTVYRQIDGEGAQSQFVLFLNVREAGYNDVESHRIAREEFFLSDADTQVVRDISPLCPMREKSVHRSLGV